MEEEGGGGVRVLFPPPEETSTNEVSNSEDKGPEWGLRFSKTTHLFWTNHHWKVGEFTTVIDLEDESTHPRN